MANQYGNNFATLIEKRYGKSAKEFLSELSLQQVTYNDAAKLLGFAAGTIRKYCHRYDVQLKPCPDPRDVVETVPPLFHSKELNKFNFLSRRWRCN